MKLLNFELKKILISKKFLYVMLFVIFSISLLFARNHIFQAFIEKEAQQEVDALIQEGQKNIKVYEEESTKVKDNKEAQDKLLAVNAMVDTLNKLRDAIAKEDWRQTLTLENNYLMQLKTYKELGGEFTVSTQEINNKLALNQKLLDRNIPPEHETYSKALPNFMKQVVDIYITFGAIIILLFLIGNILSSEFKNRSIQFLYTQPIKKTSIVSSKFWSALIVYIVMTLIAFTTVITIGLIFGERGSFYYPILIEQHNTFTFITITEYMLYALAVTSATVFLMLALSLLVSLVVKRTVASIIVLIGIFAGGYALFTYINQPDIAWYNPFQYVIPQNTILLQNTSLWYQGIPIVIGLGIVCYLLSILKIKATRIV